MSSLDRITINPAVCHGNPIIRGMRIRVMDVLEMLGSGMSRDEILEDFPYLESEDIDACLLFAAMLEADQSLIELRQLYVAGQIEGEFPVYV